MKRTGFVTAVLLVFTALSVFAQTGDDFEIEQNKQGGITITEYTGTIRGDVIIPATIEGIKVTEIGELAFSGKNDVRRRINKNITSVIIPDSVTVIGNLAFSGITKLASVTFAPNSKVTSIGMWAFKDCTSLTSIIIPNSVKSIGAEAFSECTSLASITIPNSVTGIEEGAFFYCTSLTSIIVPNSVTYIGGGAFEGCPITSITIGANKPYKDGADEIFPNNFATFYESQGKKAGTYTWSGRLWSVK